MRVELQKDDDVKVILDILFWKTARSKRRIVNGKELIDTTCQISHVMQSKPTKVVPLITTIAKQNPMDNYNKIYGKKIALAKAMANIEFLKPISQICSIDIRPRLLRQHIWNVFHQTFGKWN